VLSNRTTIAPPSPFNVTMTEPDARRRLLSILVADAAGYSRLMATDDRETLIALEASREVFRTHIAAHGGRVIDMAGDSVLAVFDAAVAPVHAALEVQQALAELARSTAPDRRMKFRIGVHLGDVIEKPDGSVYGDGVNVAARLQSLAEPGGIVVSRAIEGAVGTHAQAAFIDLGAHRVKNIAQPVHAFACQPLSTSRQSAATRAASAAARTVAVVVWGSRLRRLGAAAVAAAVLFAGASAWLAAMHFGRPVVPYSAVDRRMTFAVLPIEAPKGDAEALRLAKAAGDALQTMQEERILWVHMAPQTAVERAAASQPNLRELGAALAVHFLLRGTVFRDAPDYAFNLAIVDADTERVLDTKVLRVGPAGAPIIKPREIDAVLNSLIYNATRVEVERARDKPDKLLDVRDLTFRAFVDWRDGRADPAAAYSKAKANLDRALALAPQDLLALKVTAELNVCDCQRAWAKNTDEMEKLGVAAIDRYLAIRPDAPSMLNMRGAIFFRHHQYEEALLVAEDVLRRDPQSESALGMRTTSLLKLGKLPDAVAAANGMLANHDDVYANTLAATVHYAAGSYETSIRLARMAMSKMTKLELSDPDVGSVALTLIAAEARVGHLDRAKAALDHFYGDVPGVRTVAQVKRWLPADALELDDATRFDGLRLAGMAD